MLGIGIDFGTSNCAAAWYDGKKIQVVKIEFNSETMPTAIHISNKFESRVGSTAVEQYINENTGRRVELTSKIIGFAASSVENAFEGESRRPIYGELDDHDLPGRLFLSLKRLLGEKSTDRVPVFKRQYRLVALITPMLSQIREAIGDDVFESQKTVYVGRPVEFEGKLKDKNDRATARLKESCEYAEIKNPNFYYEPVAAALSFFTRKAIKNDCKVLSVDFGGGTLDLSVVSYSGGEYKVLGTSGLSLGGDLVDKLLYTNLLFPKLGKGLAWVRLVDGQTNDSPFPFQQFEKALLNWSITHTLNQNKYLSSISSYLSENDEGRAQLQRLKDIILHNLNYSVFQGIKQAKEKLSTVEETVIDFPDIDLSIPLTRETLNDTIAGIINEIEQEIIVLLDKIDCSKDDINFVIGTGGSSKLTACVNMLENIFPGKVESHETFTSVASGLAVASYHGLKN